MGVSANGKSVRAIVAFAPPPIEDAYVEAPMTTRLLPAGPGGFQRPSRIVQPDIAARNQLAGNMNVVVLNKDQVAFQFAEPAQVDNVLNVALAFVIARVRLARENKLDWPLPVVRQLNDVLELLKYQRGAFVSREAAGEPDGQGVGIEQLIKRDKIPGGQSLPLQEQTPARELDQ